MISPVARRYGKAIFNVAEDLDKIEDFVISLTGIGAILSDETIGSYFASPVVSKEDKIKEIANIKDLEQEINKFLVILIEKNRIQYFDEILEYFTVLKMEKEKKIAVSITSAYELSEKTVNLIQDKLKEKLGKDLVVENKIDESLIGGIVIQYGDAILDGSITRQLYEIKQKIKEGK